MRSDNYSARKLRNLIVVIVLTVHFVVSCYGATYGAGYPDASPMPRFQLTYAYGLWWTVGALSTLGHLSVPTTAVPAPDAPPVGLDGQFLLLAQHLQGQNNKLRDDTRPWRAKYPIIKKGLC